MSAKPVTMTTSQAQSTIPPTTRNQIYTALLSGDGIRNIESTMTHELQASGFMDQLKDYITDLFRSGQATTMEQARTMAMDKIKQQQRGAKSANGANGSASEAVEYDLKVPQKAVAAGAKTVQRELEKVCDVTAEDDK
ncbi:hypothetical protein P153DRAFT_297523 [Dothidotthia symphoricarpi CBS 119687]|uniref:Uncharacterized protein n=1 Tax=Dothidotthia symphoricarpi CBS 119687 TaxID=1392245 RepID=A0A6A6A3U3_9PLEO|nr:uncharacterized protein P153DRAFT_297523 [Dothidotthia symphoricarpi CBS 119687]KAF2126559.1 hypothetical protein P153DRAFT_297523 [Dothidotthia symphoricarpi CBS 119687]